MWVQGFAERKLLLVAQIVRACWEHHNVAARKERLASLRAANTEQRLYASVAAAGPAAGAAGGTPGRGTAAFAGGEGAAGGPTRRPAGAGPKPGALPAAVKVVLAAGAGAVGDCAAVAAQTTGLEVCAPVSPVPVAVAPGTAPALQAAPTLLAEQAAAESQPMVAGNCLAEVQVCGPGHGTRPVPSPVEQPRLLPPAILAHCEQQQSAAQQPQQQQRTFLLLPTQPHQQPEQQPPQAMEQHVPGLAAWREASYPSRDLPPAAHLTTQAPQEGAPAQGTMPCLPLLQQQHLQHPQPAATHPTVRPPASSGLPGSAVATLAGRAIVSVGSATTASGALISSQTDQLIQELHYRVQLAEQEAAAARQVEAGRPSPATFLGLPPLSPCMS